VFVFLLVELGRSSSKWWWNF